MLATSRHIRTDVCEGREPGLHGMCRDWDHQQKGTLAVFSLRDHWVAKDVRRHLLLGPWELFTQA